MRTTWQILMMTGLGSNRNSRGQFYFSVRTHQAACKPGSVSAMTAVGDHSSGTALARRLARPTRTTSPEAGLQVRNLPSSLFGLAPGGVYHAASVAGPAVRSYRTFSPSPADVLRHPGGQTDLCGTFPRVAPAGRYPAPCFRGARTFLDAAVADFAAVAWPPDAAAGSITGTRRLEGIPGSKSAVRSPCRRYRRSARDDSAAERRAPPAKP